MFSLIALFDFTVDFPESVRIKLIAQMADIEQRLMVGASEKLQLSSLIATFSKAQREVVKLANEAN